MSEVTVPLAHPLKHGATDILELTFGRPTLKALKAIDAAKSQGEIHVMAVTIRELVRPPLPPSVIDQIDIDDIGAIGDALAPFFPEPAVKS